jgi:hypothetical protein
MATIKHYKVVAALPSTLVADSIYLVRVGTGFDLYVTNSSGTIVAYPANYQAGSANLSALSGLTGAANKAPYFTGVGAMSVYDLTVFGRSFAAAADQAAGRTLLGLGTAATRPATTSATDTTSERLWRTNDLVKQTGPKDTTAGSVLLTGAGGWMGTAQTLTGNDYNNDSEYCGIVKNDNNSAAVNYPPQISANAPMAALNVRFGATYGWQLGVQTPGASPSDANTRAFLRCEVNGNWSSWAELWHSGNFNPAAKQDAIAAGSTAQFWRGDKTWQDLAAAVRAAVLTGLSTVSAAAVSATDTVLAAIGKLQAQINGLSAASYTNLTLLAPYTWDSAGDAADYSRPSYAKVGDVVRLRGKVTLAGTHATNATVNVTTIATLPVGFRPAKRKAFQVFWDSDSPLHFAYCLVFVNTDGTLVLVTPAASQPYPFTEGHLPLDQIWFDVAA